MSATADVSMWGVERLAGAVCAMIDRGLIDPRSLAGDALLDYASARYGDRDPLGEVRRAHNGSRRGVRETCERGCLYSDAWRCMKSGKSPLPGVVACQCECHRSNAFRKTDNTLAIRRDGDPA